MSRFPASPLVARTQPGGLVHVESMDLSTGNRFYVHSGTGTDAAGYGQSPLSPAATIDYAIGLCTANQGDIIYVMEGHAETISGAAGVNLDVAGVTVIGMGRGASRPTLTLSAVASTVAIAAASVHIENCVLLATADCTVMLDINAADARVHRCEFRSTAAKEFVTAIDVNGGAANACDRTHISECTIVSTLAAGANQGIELGEVADRVVVDGCTILGDYANAAIHNPTGKVLTNLRISNSLLENTQTGDHAIELVSACTGMLVRNMYKSDMTQATACDPGSCFSYECYHCDTNDVSAILSPAGT